MKALLRNGIVIRFEATAGEPNNPLARVILQIPRRIFSQKDTEKLKSHPDIVNVQLWEEVRDLIHPDDEIYTVDIKINSLSMRVEDMMRRAADIIAGSLSVEKIK